MSIFSNHSIPTRRLSRIISRLLPVHERLVRLFDVDWWSLVRIKFCKKKKKRSFVGYDDVNERQRLPLAPHGTHYRRRKRSRYLSTIPPFLHISSSFREYRILPRYSIGKLLTFPKRNDERDRDRSFQRV